MLGESRAGAIKRIRAVTGQSVSQARRVAQTERVRVSSQARFEAMNEAAKMGVNLAKKWVARMVNTREAHAFLNGTVLPMEEAFVVPPSQDVLYKGKKGAKTGGGYSIRFPGDPDAPARAVINCHCMLVPVVEKAGLERNSMA